MWCTISPKSSAKAGAGHKAKSTAAVTAATSVLDLGFSVIVVSFVVWGRLVCRRVGLIRLLLLLAMAAFVAGDSEMSFQRSQFVDVDEANDVDHRKLFRLRHQNHQTRDFVALLQNVDFVVFFRAPAAALHDPRSEER